MKLCTRSAARGRNFPSKLFGLSNNSQKHSTFPPHSRYSDAVMATMLEKFKGFNPLRYVGAARVEESFRDEAPESSNEEEEDSIAAQSDDAGEETSHLVDAMNDVAKFRKAVDKIVEETNRTANNTVLNNSQSTPQTSPQPDPPDEQQLRRSPRRPKRKILEWDTLEVKTGASEGQQQGSPKSAAPRRKSQGLSKRRKTATTVAQSRPGDLELPSDDERTAPQPTARLTNVPNLRKPRNLTRKPTPKSPFKNLGEIALNESGVNVSDITPIPTRNRPATRQNAPPESTEENRITRPKPRRRPRAKSPEAATESEVAPPSQSRRRQRAESPEEAAEPEVEPTPQASGSRRQQVTQNGDVEADEDAEAEARKLERRRKKARRGIENAVETFHCGRAWVDMIVAGAFISGSASTDVESSKGKRASEIIDKIRILFQPARSRSAPDVFELIDDMVPYQRAYNQVLQEFDPKIEDGTRERVKEGRDLYLHLIPDLIVSCRAALQLLFENTELEGSEYELISIVLQLTMHTANIAQEWQPRPSTLETRVLQSVRNDVSKNLSRIHGLFSKEARDKTTLVHETARLEEFAIMQKRNNEAFWNKIWAHRAEKIRRPRIPLREIPVVDVDDAVDDSGRPFDSNVRTRSAPGVSTGVGLRPQAMHTERAPRAWSASETQTLLVGLELYTGKDRFQQIVDAKAEQLEGISLEDMIQRARVLKRLIMADPNVCNDPRYDYLRSVSG